MSNIRENLQCVQALLKFDLFVKWVGEKIDSWLHKNVNSDLIFFFTEKPQVDNKRS